MKKTNEDEKLNDQEDENNELNYIDNEEIDDKNIETKNDAELNYYENEEVDNKNFEQTDNVNYLD